MKKLLILFLLTFALVAQVKASEISLLPNPATSSWITMYDLEVHQLKTGTRYPALGWKFLYIDGQVITDFDTIALALGLGIEIIELGRSLGLKVYLSENVNIGFNGGYNFSTRKPVWGPWGGIKITF